MKFKHKEYKSKNNNNKYLTLKNQKINFQKEIN